MKRLILWAPLAVFILFIAFFAQGLIKPENKAIPSQLIGKPMPAFALSPAIAGKPGLASADLANGKAHLVNIFASWCIPCATEAAQLAQLAEAGVPIVGVAIRDRPEDLQAFLARNGDPFRAIGADVNSSVQIALGSSGVPESFVVDGKGIIRKQHIGEIRPEDMPAILSAIAEAK